MTFLYDLVLVIEFSTFERVMKKTTFLIFEIGFFSGTAHGRIFGWRVLNLTGEYCGIGIIFQLPNVFLIFRSFSQSPLAPPRWIVVSRPLAHPIGLSVSSMHVNYNANAVRSDRKQLFCRCRQNVTSTRLHYRSVVPQTSRTSDELAAAGSDDGIHVQSEQ